MLIIYFIIIFIIILEFLLGSLFVYNKRRRLKTISEKIPLWLTLSAASFFTPMAIVILYILTSFIPRFYVIHDTLYKIFYWPLFPLIILGKPIIQISFIFGQIVLAPLLRPYMNGDKSYGLEIFLFAGWIITPLYYGVLGGVVGKVIQLLIKIKQIHKQNLGS